MTHERFDDGDLSPVEDEQIEVLRGWRSALTVTDDVADAVEVATKDSPSVTAIAKHAVERFQRALEAEDHPFPAFSGLILGLRTAIPDREALSKRLSLDTATLARFERGEIHPWWFPRASGIAATRILPPESRWHVAIQAALSQSAEAKPPAADEGWLRDAPWGADIPVEVATLAVEERITAEPGQLAENTRVRWTATGEVGLVLRRVGGDLYEVSLPTGVRYVPASELDIGSGTLRDRILAKAIGRLPLVEQRLRSLYLDYAYRFDELAGLTNARVEPKPHQVFVAWRVLQKVRPRMILADEVGLGKTIEAGLIVKELRARGLADRVLIVVPASLVTQWLWEFRSKFNLEFDVYDGAKIKELKRRAPNANPWETNDSVICSLPFAQRDQHARDILDAGWDVVIFDEAHRVRRRSGSVTKAYTLAENMRFDTFGMLLLTATPIQLEAYELYSLIDLIEPGLFQKGERAFERQRGHIAKLNQLMGLLNQFGGLSEAERVLRCRELTKPIAQFLDIDRAPEEQAAALADSAARAAAEQKLHEEHPLVEVMVRNRKNAIPEAFAARSASSIRVQMSPFEEDVYDQVTMYVREGFNRAKEARNMTAGFLMVAFQKMLTSSSYALARSFERRIQRLNATLSKKTMLEATPERELVSASTRRRAWEPTRPQWQDAEEISAALDDAFSRIPKDEADLADSATRAEIEDLRSLVAQLDSLDDSKLAALQGFLGETFGADPTEKVIIFTQFIETQTYLRKAVSSAYDVQIFNGTMNPDEKDRAVQRFRASGQILISTEAGGEGRNFQFAHIVVNYDLPWNPMKIEQRIGRVDRIGQKRIVEVRNLFLANSTGTSLDERVMTVLAERINVFEESIGSLDPILGDVEDAIRRVALEVAPDEQEEAFQLLGAEIQRQIHDARRMEERLQDFIMDRNSLRLDKAKELLGQKHLAGPADLERFANDYLTFHGGAVDEHAKGGQVISMPMPLAHRLRWRSNRVRGTFDPERALEFEEIDFFAVGHPIVDAIMSAAVDETLSSSIAVYEEAGATDRWLLELWYRVDVGGVRPDQQFRVHRVTPTEVVASEAVQQLPSLSDEIGANEVPLSPDDIRQALSRSEEHLAKELRRLQEERQPVNAEMYKREIKRLERITTYRREKELHTIQAQEERIERLEHEGTPEERRILPALRGRIERARERLERIRLDEVEERTQIEERSRLTLSFEPVAAAFVHQRSDD